jgi:hypothetical protein
MVTTPLRRRSRRWPLYLAAIPGSCSCHRFFHWVFVERRNWQTYPGTLARLAELLGQMAEIRQRAIRDLSFDERLAECAHEARKQARLLPNGALRDALLEKARQYEVQISMNAWLLTPSARSAETNR